MGTNLWGAGDKNQGLVRYPRFMREMSHSEAFEFLTAGTRTGKLATVRPDGRPHVVPIWFVVDDQDLVFNTGHNSVKARNMAADSLAAVAVDDQEPLYAHVIIEGNVEISDDLAEVRRYATLIGGRYMGADRAEEYGARNGVEGELVVRLKVSKLIAQADTAG